MKVDVLVVGAGLAGCVIAERCAAAGHSVLMVERRDHIGGNAYDEKDAAGVLVHRYGPHIFHTNSHNVVEYLSRFTDWFPYEHRVLSSVGGHLYPVPINRTTINQLYGWDLDEAGVARYLERVRETRQVIRNSEDAVLNSVGRVLCEIFFRNYTRKQWGVDLTELSPGVAGRIPVRTNDDDRYFTEKYQQMPRDGFTAMFRNMLQSPLISLELGTSLQQMRRIRAGHVFYTGPIDEYYNFCFGHLPYRSIRIEQEHLPNLETYQPVATVNFPNDFAFTRITEFKHLTHQRHSGTSIVREYPQSQGDPFYPVPTPQNQARYLQYKNLANAERYVSFVGRLAQYRYHNMDQVVAAALKLVNDYLGSAALLRVAGTAARA